jgi:hypothetical protein
METIKLLENMTGCVTQGHKTIPAGTVMHKYYSLLQWSYYKDADGNVLIIMGFNSPDWNKVAQVN